MDESEFVARVVGRLRKLREEQGISQAELSRRTGLSRSGIRHMEDGDVTPTLQFLLRLSSELKAKLSDVIRDVEGESTG